MIFSQPTRRAQPCAPVGNGYLCFKEISVSFSAFYRLQLSSCGEKECLTVTRVVRFVGDSRFFIFFASETVYGHMNPLQIPSVCHSVFTIKNQC